MRGSSEKKNPPTERLMNDSGKGGFLSNFLNFSPRERERECHVSYTRLVYSIDEYIKENATTKNAG